MSGFAIDPHAAGVPLPQNAQDAQNLVDRSAPLSANGGPDATSSPQSSRKAARTLDPKLAKAAQEFEAVFIRQLLKPLEKAGQMGKAGPVSSGSDVYGSMMVGAVADAASGGGGIGLAEMVLKALTDAGKVAPKSAPQTTTANSPTELNQNKIKSL